MYKHKKHNVGRGSAKREIIWVSLEEIYVPERTVERILRKDRHQIDALRACYESGREMVRVVLRARFDGGYNVEDGRHRVIAAKEAGETAIEAVII